jgi:Ca-activated chloride channel homolog
MNERLLPDDPRITAYALGELSGEERATVEAALRENGELRRVVDEIRATSEQIEAALAIEPILEAATPVAPQRMRPPVKTATARPSATGTVGPGRRGQRPADEYRRRAKTKFIQFPQFYYVIGLAAAACFAVLVVLNRPQHEAKQRQARMAAEAQAAARKAQTRVVTIPLAPVENEAAAPTSLALDLPATTSPTAGPAPLPRPAFIDGSLSLVEQTRHEPLSNETSTEPVTPALTEPSAGRSSATPALASTSPSNNAPQAGEPAIGAAPVTPAVNPGGGGKSDAGGRTSPASVASTAKSPTSRELSFGIKPDDDIVLLDAFTVNADHLYAFTTLLEMNRADQATRGMSEQRYRPRPPAGAQFARNTETYATAIDNDFVRVVESPLSTFSVDVDTASYANVRRMIEHGALPPRGAVRIEELLNYFPFRYAPPAAARGEVPPFAASLEVATAPWAPTHRLVRIGLKGREVTTRERPAANLVFLIDVSASMSDANKLPLVKESLRLLLGKLRPDDRVAIVVYAGASGLALPSTPVAKSAQIIKALDDLRPGGATNGAMGIHLAYDIAKANFAENGINRVILCTDGDFNVGTTSDAELVQVIEEKAASGVFLTVLGFGMGDFKDATLEKLASKGNGLYGYIDNRREAEKLLVEQVSGTLATIAKDVKIQVEFNPARVSSYRLIGYENRQLRREDFNNDNVDGGEIGAGHTVTALYEVVPVGAEDRVAARPMDDLKYQVKGAVSSRLEMPIGPEAPPSNEMLTVKVRYKKPDGRISRKLEFPLVDAGAAFANASADFRFAAAVAEFGMILRESPHRGAGTLGDVVAWAASAATTPASDPGGYRGEFIDLVRKTQRMLR